MTPYRIALPVELFNRRRGEIDSWFRELKIRRVHSISEIRWSSRPAFMFKIGGARDPNFFYRDLDEEASWVHFYFSSSDLAVLFKLTWGGS